MKIALVVALSFVASSDPYGLYKLYKTKRAKAVVGYAVTHNEDPYELLAIAITESNLNPKAVSSAGAVGLMQVMCKFWYKRFDYKSITECNKGLLKPQANIKAGVEILTLYRNNYKQCAGDYAYRCYYAGKGWRKFRGKTKKSIIRYENKVRERREFLHKHYSKFIEDIRDSYIERS